MARTGTRPIPDKIAGELQYAAEQNYVDSKSIDPGLNDAWSSVVKFDDEYYPPERTISINTTYTIDATNAGTGNGRCDQITASGNRVLTFTGFTIIKSDIAPVGNTITLVDGDSYTIVFLRRGSISEIYLASTNIGTILAPITISNITVSSQNTFIDLVVNIGAYGNALASTPVLLSDINTVFAANGGTATGWTGTSVKRNDSDVEGSASALTGGETTIRIFGSIAGIADGNEIITIWPLSGASIYGADGQAMDAGQSGSDNLNIAITYEAESLALFARMTTAGHTPGDVRKGVINDLIAGMKSDGDWAKLDVFHLYAAAASSVAVLNWLADANNAISNTSTFTIDDSFGFNGSSQYMDSNFIPSTDVSNASLDDIMTGVFVGTVGPITGGEALFGANRNTTEPKTAIQLSAEGITTLWTRLNSFTLGSHVVDSGEFLTDTHYTARRTGSANIDLLKNAVIVDAQASASVALPDRKIYVAANNVESLGTTGYLNIEIRAFYVAKGDASVTNIQSRINTYLTAVGAI